MIKYVTTRHPNGAVERLLVDLTPIVVISKKLASMSDVLITLPLGTKRKLGVVAVVDDTNGDMADMVLSYLSIGAPIDVNSDTFTLLTAWLIAEPTLNITQTHIDDIVALAV